MYDPLKQEEEKYKYNHLFTANLKFPLNNKSVINSSFIFILDFSFHFFFLLDFAISKSAINFLFPKEVAER